MEAMDLKRNPPQRVVIETEQAALDSLGSASSQPPWRDAQKTLPFGLLTPREFEVFCFLLLLREKAPKESVVLYGDTKDLGRDIVRRLENGTVELIQCKRLSQGMKEKEVLEELEKLCRNEFLGLLPCTHYHVVFYVSGELRPAANDLMLERDIWIRKTQELFRGKKDRAKRKELIGYARKWWPEPTSQVGAQISERAEQHQTLVERFFSIRKVVDAQAAEQLRKAVNDFNEITVLPTYRKAPMELKSLIEETEHRNPGLAIEYRQTAGAVEYRVGVKAGEGPVHLGTLQLPTGRAHEMIAQGRPIILHEGEFEWKSAFDLSPLYPTGTAPTKLVVTPVLPNRQLAIRLCCMRGEKCVADIPFCYMKAVRWGSEEQEFLIFGDKLAGQISLTFVPSTKAMEISLKQDLASKPLPSSLSWIKLIRALHQGGELLIESLEHGMLLRGGTASAASLPRGSRKMWLFLSFLKVISEEFRLEMVTPDKCSAEDFENARMLAMAIRHGRVINRLATGTMTINTTKDLMMPLLPWIADRPIIYEGEAFFTILSHKLPPIKQRVTFKKAWPADGEEALQERVATASGESELEVKLRTEGMTFEFPQWTKKGERSLASGPDD